jgi:hypothetical protein
LGPLRSKALLLEWPKDNVGLAKVARARTYLAVYANGTLVARGNRNALTKIDRRAVLSGFASVETAWSKPARNGA